MKKAATVWLFVAVFILMAGCSFTTANLSDVKIASEIDSDLKPVTPADRFAADAPMIYVTGTLNNAPEGTKIKIEWVYVETEPHTLIDVIELETQEITSDFESHLSKPDNGWPVGQYEVRLYIDDNEEPAEIAAFVVE